MRRRDVFGRLFGLAAAPAVVTAGAPAEEVQAWQFLSPQCSCGWMLQCQSRYPSAEVLTVSCSCGRVVKTPFWRAIHGPR